MTRLNVVPVGLDQIIVLYGDPDADHNFILDLDWARDNLVMVTLPFSMRLSWRPTTYIQKVQCHKLIADALVDALGGIMDARGLGYLHATGLDMWGGCFNFRSARGLSKLSTHSWGIAVDINPHLAPLGEIPAMPAFITDAFEQRGFEWGGHWVRPDGMHFQACGGY